MTPDAHHTIDARGRELELEFFRVEDQVQLEGAIEERRGGSARDALSKASGITNAIVLDKLIELKVRAETVTALSIVPLVEVAWADGTLDAKERAVVMGAAQRSGFVPGSVEHAMLEAWLHRRPDPKLMIAWTHLVQGMCESFGPAATEKLKSSLMERARAVAGASGGVLGLGSKISKAESEVLERLEKAFSRSK